MSENTRPPTEEEVENIIEEQRDFVSSHLEIVGQGLMAHGIEAPLIAQEFIEMGIGQFFSDYHANHKDKFSLDDFQILIKEKLREVVDMTAEAYVESLKDAVLHEANTQTKH